MTAVKQTAYKCTSNKLPENKELRKPFTTVHCHVDSHHRPTTVALCGLRHHQMPASNSQTLFQHIWYEKLLRASRQTCASKEQLLVMFAGGKWHLPDCYLCNMCNNYAKRQTVSMLQEYRIQELAIVRNISLSALLFFFFPLPAVLTFSPWSQTEPKYLISSGKKGRVNQLPLTCEIQTKIWGIKHLHKSKFSRKTSCFNSSII